MGRTELGRRLKEARLARKMTQSEVVGDFITRNMLSQIESGTAMPSVKTLEYLSKALEIPLDVLLADENGEETTLEILLQAKEYFRMGNYEGVIHVLEPERGGDSILFDEVQALLARSFLFMAQEEKKKLESLDKGKREALPERAGVQERLAGYAREAGRAAANGIYASRELRMEALLLEHMWEEV